MSEFKQGKEQVFPLSLKTVGLAEKNVISAGNLIGLEIINPINLYRVEELATHLKFTDDGSSVGNKIVRVKVQDDFSFPTITKKIDLSISAVGGVLELKKEITPLLNPTGRNVVVIEFNGYMQGTINVFKADMLYSVLGIY